MRNMIGCVMYGSQLVYCREQGSMGCSVCEEERMSNMCCEREHYICDRFHTDDLGMVAALCLSSRSWGPVEVMDALMRLPGIHMHGPEHHILVRFVLLTDYRNAGGDIDLEQTLAEMRRRGS